MNVTEDTSSDAVFGINLDVVRLAYVDTAVWQPAAAEKPLLRDVTFRADAGRVTAILSSVEKAGRTLLEVVSRRREFGRYSGEVLVSGMPQGDHFIRNTAYVPQDALYQAGLSFEETVHFAVQLHADASAPSQEILERTHSLLEIMDLMWCRDNRIQEATDRGAIGGQLKRLSIAVALAGFASLLFLDDPVTKLDSAVATDTMHHLALLAKRMHTVLCTLTRPAPQVFSFVDSVILLSGSRLIFAGDASIALTYFASPDLGYVLDSTMPPADFMLNIAEGRERPRYVRQPLTANELAVRFHSSSVFRMPARELRERGSFDIISYRFQDKPAPLRWQMQTLLRRATLVKCREGSQHLQALVRCASLGVYFGLLQFKQGKLPRFLMSVVDAPYGKVTNCASCLFYLVIFPWAMHIPAIDRMCQRFRLFHYERIAGTTHPLAFAVTTFVSEMPFVLAFLAFFTLPVYLLMQFHISADNLLFVLSLTSLTSFAGWLVIGALTAFTLKTSAARDAYLLLFLALVLLSGYPAHLPDVKDFWEYISRVNPLRWAFQGMMAWAMRGHADSDQFLGTYGFDDWGHRTALLYMAIIVMVAMIPYILALLPRPTKLVHFKWTIREARPPPPTQSRRESEDTTFIAQPLLLRKIPPTVDNIGSDDSGDESETGPSDGSATHTGFNIFFRNLSYTPPVPFNVWRPFACGETGRPALHSATGTIYPGMLTAIMGISGSGKTALLETLAGRVSAKHVSGEIAYDSRVPTPSFLRHNTAFVVDDDAHFPGFTVRETVQYAAKLRFRGAAAITRSIQVNQTLNRLALRKVSDKRVDKLSPGERRRLSVAEEVVSMPCTIFLEEPTTGLETHDVVDIVNCLRDMCFEQRTVLATVHKPQEIIFDMFDALILLAQGRVVFSGSPAAASTFFASSPLCFIRTKGQNPADFVVDASGGLVDNSSGEIIGPARLEVVWQGSAEFESIRESVESGMVRKHNDHRSLAHEAGMWSFPQHPMTAMATLLQRQSKRIVTEYRTALLLTSVVQLAVAALIGTIFYHQRDELYNSAASMYLSVVAIVTGVADSARYLWLSRRVFEKERKNGLYPIAVHWAVGLLPMLALRALQGAALGMTIRAMVQHIDKESVILASCLFYAVLGGTSLCVLDLAVAIANRIGDIYGTAKNVVQNVGEIYGILPIFIIISVSLSGLMVQLSSLPASMAWAADTSVLRWSIQFLVINEYEHDRVTFPDLVVDGAVVLTGRQQYENFLADLDFDAQSKWYCLNVLIFYAVVLRLATLLAMFLTHGRVYSGGKALPLDD